MGRKLLVEVVYIRLFLMVGVVMYHAFAPFGGVWDSIADVSVYYWIDKFWQSFFMEGFVFISGYVFGFQIKENGQIGKPFDTVAFIWKKFVRLIIPSILFSILYLLILKRPDGFEWHLLLDILNGEGHLWFLPMLFGCFIGCLALEKIPVSRKFKLAVVLLLAVIPLPEIPLRINLSLHYLLFFYAGFLMQGNCSSLPDCLYSKRGVFTQAILFVLALVGLTLIREHAIADIVRQGGLVQKVWGLFVQNILALIYSSLGVAALYSLAVLFVRKQVGRVSDRWISLSGNCFGVYIFQQFILQYLYYHTNVFAPFSVYVMPWIGFVVAFSLSLLLSVLVRRMRWGRFLLG